MAKLCLCKRMKSSKQSLQSLSRSHIRAYGGQRINIRIHCQLHLWDFLICHYMLLRYYYNYELLLHLDMISPICNSSVTVSRNELSTNEFLIFNYVICSNVQIVWQTPIQYHSPHLAAKTLPDDPTTYLKRSCSWCSRAENYTIRLRKNQNIKYN